MESLLLTAEWPMSPLVIEPVMIQSSFIINPFSAFLLSNCSKVQMAYLYAWNLECLI
ncbi:hypothetical protein Lalb_Chr06g0162941 [Lupinus albus]|uniref:Uncharacterized protein n=1 Tax=Lupinus albus TaxID=3870 RepID=A0A6A4QD00_LUPAL|nr:hypothetical protein Lalb_Chr06g0162941 [Lupinus albus]